MDSPASSTKPHISIDSEFGSRPRASRTYSRGSTYASSTTSLKDSLLNSPSRKISKFFETIRWKPDNEFGNENENTSLARQDDNNIKTLTRTVIDSFSSIRSRRWAGKEEDQGTSTSRSRSISPLKNRATNQGEVSYPPRRRKSVGDLFTSIRGTLGRASSKTSSILQQGFRCEDDLEQSDTPQMTQPNITITDTPR